MSEPGIHNNQVYTSRYTSWHESVPPLLDAANLRERLEKEKRVLIKPNLVEPLHPPITTPVGLIETLVKYILANHPGLEIIIGEGCGSSSNSTMQIFAAMGYNRLCSLKKVALLDLNEAPLVQLQNNGCRHWPEMHLPKIIFESFLISVPVLKAHSLADVTLTMKNMIGVAPPAHYQQGGAWKKSAFHHNIHEAIFDLNCYRTPDFTLLDATVGMQEAHLWGPACNPPCNRIAASFDPVAIDSYGCKLLGIKWDSVGHLVMAHGKLGRAAPLSISEV